MAQEECGVNDHDDDEVGYELERADQMFRVTHGLLFRPASRSLRLSRVSRGPFGGFADALSDMARRAPGS